MNIITYEHKKYGNFRVYIPEESDTINITHRILHSNYESDIDAWIGRFNEHRTIEFITDWEVDLSDKVRGTIRIEARVNRTRKETSVGDIIFDVRDDRNKKVPDKLSKKIENDMSYEIGDFIYHNYAKIYEQSVMNYKKACSDKLVSVIANCSEALLKLQEL